MTHDKKGDGIRLIPPGAHRPFRFQQTLSISIVFLLFIIPSSAILTPIRASDQAPFPIKHVVIVMQENHSFDNYFGTFPGALGRYTNGTCITQSGYIGCIHPYHLTSDTAAGDPCHSWGCLHSDYADGTNEGFYAISGMLSFGYYDHRNIPYYWELATNYTLMDNYFSSVMGPTLPNHLFLVAGQSGGEIGDHQHMRGLNGTYNLNISSIFPELSNHHISWTSYSWIAPVNWNAPAFIIPVEKNATLDKNVKYPSDFFNDVKSGNLSQVVWVMPKSDVVSDHPPYNVRLGEEWVRSIIGTIEASKYWNSTAILLTWDESGGWYDMVPPPQVDKFGYGFRVPMIVISPYAKRGFVDHARADHTSTLAFIEKVFNLPPLTERDARASDLIEAFSFSTSQPPTVTPTVITTGSTIILALVGTVIALIAIAAAMALRRPRNANHIPIDLQPPSS